MMGQNLLIAVLVVFVMARSTEQRDAKSFLRDLLARSELERKLPAHEAVGSWATVRPDNGGIAMCPTGFWNLYDSCFMAAGEKMTLAAAKKTCRGLNAELASVETEKEFKAIHDWLQSEELSMAEKRKSPAYWVDASCADDKWTNKKGSDGKCPEFVWSTGVKLSIKSPMWAFNRPRAWISAAVNAPDGVAMFWKDSWKFDNKPSGTMYASALCETKAVGTHEPTLIDSGAITSYWAPETPAPPINSADSGWHYLPGVKHDRAERSLEDMEEEMLALIQEIQQERKLRDLLTDED